MAGNPVLSHPNGGRLQSAFENLDFMLSIDIYLNETTRHADVILPSPSEATHSNFHFFYIPFMVRKIAKWTAPLFETEAGQIHDRSEEHTSELQSLMRISYAVFCLKKQKI